MGGVPAAPAPLDRPSERQSEPSFGREALARSVMNLEESTLEITPQSLAAPTQRSPTSAESEASGTGASAASDTRPRQNVEKTLELSDSDLVPTSTPNR
jgi:hypothetical protein